MPLTGLQIFKLLPDTNCKKCGYPTCLTFAMKLAAGKESLEKCPDASPESKAALGAASAPPIRRVTIGRGERALTVGEETVFFRHEKTFVRRPGLFQTFDPAGLPAVERDARLDHWRGIRIERAGETFQVDGIAVVETPGAPQAAVDAGIAAAARGFPVAILAATLPGAAAVAERIREDRPLLVPPAGANLEGYAGLAVRLGIPLVVGAPDLRSLADRAREAGREGVSDILLEPPGADPRSLHHSLTAIRRGALDRIHPGLGHPVFLRVGAGEIEKAVLGITKFASLLALADSGGEVWLPLWTLRQNIYTAKTSPDGPRPLRHRRAQRPVAAAGHFQFLLDLLYCLDGGRGHGRGVPLGRGRCRGAERADRLVGRQVFGRPRGPSPPPDEGRRSGEPPHRDHSRICAGNFRRTGGCPG